MALKISSNLEILSEQHVWWKYYVYVLLLFKNFMLWTSICRRHFGFDLKVGNESLNYFFEWNFHIRMEKAGISLPKWRFELIFEPLVINILFNLKSIVIFNQTSNCHRIYIRWSISLGKFFWLIWIEWAPALFRVIFITSLIVPG